MVDKEKHLKDEIVAVGRRLYETGLAVATSGNISARLEAANILITASQSFLGNLSEDDIVSVNYEINEALDKKKASSELPLHSLIYKNTSKQRILHCHPPLINDYFAVCSNLKALTFETKCFLGDVPVIKHDTPTVTRPDEVIEALQSNNLIVLKNHGVVAVADTFKEALALVEALEEAIRVAAVARIFDKDALDDLDKALKERLVKVEVGHPMFSREHIQAIVDLVNEDEFMAQKGKELDLTVKLAIKLDHSDKVYKFIFEKGKIVGLDSDGDAPFVISGPANIWEQVFLGKLNSFVAVTQGKMKLQGQLGQLSRWYVPFSRLFELFKQVKFT